MNTFHAFLVIKDMAKNLLLWVFSTLLTGLSWLHDHSAKAAKKEEGIPNPPETYADTIVQQLDEVVVTAFNRRQDLVQIPGALTSVGSVVLQREKPAVNMLPVFRNAPGVFAQQGATNTSRLTIRGTGARVPYATGKIRGYLNEIPLTNASGITFIEDIDPAIIESIQVIKGPAPSVYGAGLGGTIVLNARRPQAHATGVSNAMQLGSFGLLRNVTTLDMVQDRLAASLVYSHTQSDGYRQNNEFRRDAATLVSHFEAGSHTQFTTLLAFSDLKSHIPSSIDSTTYAQQPESAAANWKKTRGYEDSRRALGGLSLSGSYHPRLQIHAGIFGLWHDEKEMRPFDVFYEERYTLGSRLRVVLRQVMGIEGLELSTGGEVFAENYRYSNHENLQGEGIQGEQLTRNREQVASYNLFMQTDGSFGRLNVSGGLNLNYTRRDYRDLFHTGALNRSGVYDYGVMVSPRLAAGYMYYPQQSVFLSLSHGFAPPSLDETLNHDGVINPHIRPEKSWNLELGFRGQAARGRFFYDLTFYQMQVEDLLVALRIAEDEWVGRNAGQSRHRGMESEIHWVVLQETHSATLHEISLRANASIHDYTFIDFVDHDQDFGGNTIPGVPDRIFFTSLYAQSSQGLYLMPAWRYVGSMVMNDANSRHTQSYHTTDITAGYTSTLFGQVHFDLFFQIRNLLDKKYASMILVNAPSFGGAQPRYYYPGLPRHFAVGLKAAL